MDEKIKSLTDAVNNTTESEKSKKIDTINTALKALVLDWKFSVPKKDNPTEQESKTFDGNTNNDEIASIIIESLIKDEPDQVKENKYKSDLTAALQWARDALKTLASESQIRQAIENETTQTSDSLSGLATEVNDNMHLYSTQELAKFVEAWEQKGKSRKELRATPWYIRTIQNFILELWAQDPSIDKKKLEDSIYGNATEAWVLTIQKILNKPPYNSYKNLIEDGKPGPDTLWALLYPIDGKITWDKLLEDKKSGKLIITPELVKKKENNNTENNNTETKKTQIENNKKIKSTVPEWVSETKKKVEPEIKKKVQKEGNKKIEDYTKDNIKEVSDNNIIRASEKKIEEGLGNYLLKNPIIFEWENANLYQDYFNKKSKWGKIIFGKSNPHAIDNQLSIGSLRMNIKPIDYLKKDYTINYLTLTRAIKNDIIKQVNKEKINKEEEKLRKDYYIIKRYLEGTTFSIDYLFPKNEQHILVQAFFKNFENEEVEFDRNDSVFDKEKKWMTVEFDKRWNNEQINNKNNPYGSKWFIYLQWRTINWEVNKEQIKKDIKFLINQKIKKAHPEYNYKN